MAKQETDEKKTSGFPPAETGNASNPSGEEGLESVQHNQLIDERGEKYLREVASPEDYPDDEDWQDAEKTLDNSKKESVSTEN